MESVMNARSARTPAIVGLVALVLLSPLASCASGGSGRVGETASAGAGIGAGIGLLIGALRGRPLEGLAVGAAVGAGQGAYEGWRQEQDDERTRELADAIRESRAGAAQSPADPSSRAREELTRFLGVWSMDGWAQEPGESRLTVRAQVNGSIEMGHFVELAYIDVQVTGMDAKIWGTSTLGYDAESGYTISTRFNTVPQAFRLTGTFDSSSRTFTFADGDARVVVQFENPDRFTTETVVRVNGRDVTVESYRFTRT